ncbi:MULTISPECIES: EVE domain-containing protein [Cyanophyceae]|uniref:EVE domain-containing protein n=1 Tax=Cyanophyceae TaxID=3028117 RepID=UPI00232A982D|nr:MULTISPECIES: EVE domain-containing protein [Cyanophyceae]MDB9356485.1 EVE domain-containing protein [Nodularia spumigena CS-587/03]MDB9304757.1 EVE domain-containing protein [Nodularia spumigena CS-591/12]MDB9319381.1 EVE domain-containing protein [Nodularia spumigena CS-590/01A]MDB9323469.1 EVE domain-containing protein [Nodularia spumigena CS-591/07A]MDB9326128.1 EVE domain-containing protein [Nodularia spumigena CS-590/02]
MAYWLLKTEPEKYSYFNLEQDGSTVWDGVNNALALKHLRNMLLGDLAFIYHTGQERQIIGIAEVVNQPYADPTLNDAKRVVVDVKALRRVSVPLSLAQIKQNGQFTDFDLLRLPRLSVVPVSEFYWQRLISLTDSTK